MIYPTQDVMTCKRKAALAVMLKFWYPVRLNASLNRNKAVQEGNGEDSKYGQRNGI
jgi:hypothetical protein